MGERTEANEREKLYEEIWKELRWFSPSCQSAINLDPRGHRNLAHAAEGILLSRRVEVDSPNGSGEQPLDSLHWEEQSVRLVA